ncbi:hypothetical protein C8F04DRAFT_1318708 [Mycena alexandri]|uniref:Uncharacterized protein n=1 Tax=Mycena alexandri TaxID=1745969 RepID=A0AAD6T7N8_9AGAR|nr:hypothetical protein C8F04DRAFT_1318708 [Mycena alexandri]
MLVGRAVHPVTAGDKKSESCRRWQKKKAEQRTLRPAMFLMLSTRRANKYTKSRAIVGRRVRLECLQGNSVSATGRKQSSLTRQPTMLEAEGDCPRPSTNYGGWWTLPLRRPPPSPPSSLPVTAAVVTAAVVTAAVVTADSVPSATAITGARCHQTAFPITSPVNNTSRTSHTATPAHHPDAPARRPDPRPRPY